MIKNSKNENKNAKYFIDKFSMISHPEGGWYSEIYKSTNSVDGSSFDQQKYEGKRSVCTLIYFLLQEGEMSSFHKLKSDEICHYYYGDRLTLYEIESKTGELLIHKLGHNFDEEEKLNVIVKAGNWFASICEKEKSQSSTFSRISNSK